MKLVGRRNFSRLLTSLALATAAGAPAGAPAAQADPPACAPVTTRAQSYKPAVRRRGPIAPGVRVKLRVSTPSLLTITPTLRWFEGGQQSVQLSSRTLRTPGSRNLRIQLPGATGGLQVGDRITVDMKITAAPDSSPGCVSAPSQQVVFRTRVIVVLDLPQAPRLVRPAL